MDLQDMVQGGLANYKLQKHVAEQHIRYDTVLLKYIHSKNTTYILWIHLGI